MRWLGKVLRGILMGILILFCAALFYILVIMGDTPDTAVDAPPAVVEQVPEGGAQASP